MQLERVPLGILLALGLASSACTGFATPPCLVAEEDWSAPADDPGRIPDARPDRGGPAEDARGGGSADDRSKPDEDEAVAPCLSLVAEDPPPEPDVEPCLSPLPKTEIEFDVCLSPAPPQDRPRKTRRERRGKTKLSPCLRVDPSSLDDPSPEIFMEQGAAPGLNPGQDDARGTILDAFADTLPPDVLDRLRRRRT
jgi:hypothetical protein